MNRLKLEKQMTVLNLLVEGNSIRSAERITGVHRDTIMRLMVRVGRACQVFMEQTMRDLDCERLELDEIWTFCGKKEARVKGMQRYNKSIGDQYVFYAIDPATKLIPVCTIGKRTRLTTYDFIHRLNGCLNGNRPQITTDAFLGYLGVIQLVFWGRVDYATITKEYKSVATGRGRYAPPKVSKTRKKIRCGNPDEKYICTSYVERHNLTIRTFMRRFTRLSLGFSKKLENLKAAVALHFAYYNFCWIPRTTGVTPAMRAGITHKRWTLADLYKQAVANSI
jgi:IS1 family transposase